MINGGGGIMSGVKQALPILFKKKDPLDEVQQQKDPLNEVQQQKDPLNEVLKFIEEFKRNSNFVLIIKSLLLEQENKIKQFKDLKKKDLDNIILNKDISYEEIYILYVIVNDLYYYFNTIKNIDIKVYIDNLLDLLKLHMHNKHIKDKYQPARDHFNTYYDIYTEQIKSRSKLIDDNLLILQLPIIKNYEQPKQQMIQKSDTIIINQLILDLTNNKNEFYVKLLDILNRLNEEDIHTHSKFILDSINEIKNLPLPTDEYYKRNKESINSLLSKYANLKKGGGKLQNTKLKLLIDHILLQMK